MSESNVQGGRPLSDNRTHDSIEDAAGQRAKILKIQDTLYAAGGGVIAFCVWSFIKTFLFLSFMDADTVRRLIGIEDDSLAFTVYVVTVIVVIVDLLIRVYIGRSARAEGRGEKRGSFYLVMAVVAAIANASSLIGIMFGTSFVLSPLSAIVSIAIEATAIAALILVVVSSIRLRSMARTEG